MFEDQITQAAQIANYGLPMVDRTLMAPLQSLNEICLKVHQNQTSEVDHLLHYENEAKNGSPTHFNNNKVESTSSQR